MKPIRLSGHAKEQLLFRGTTEEEVIEIVRTSPWQPAELGRLECKRDIPFENKWHNRYYRIKQVRLDLCGRRQRNRCGNCIYLFFRKGEVEMRIAYDAEVDALYIRFIETTVTTKHVTEGIAVDYDAEGKIAGIEILDALKRFGSKDVFKKVTLEDLALHAK